MKEYVIVYYTLKQASIAFNEFAEIMASSDYFCKVYTSRREIKILIPCKEDISIKFGDSSWWERVGHIGFRGVAIPGSVFDRAPKRVGDVTYTKVTLTKDDKIEPTDFNWFDFRSTTSFIDEDIVKGD